MPSWSLSPSIALIPSLLTCSFLFIREETSKGCFFLFFGQKSISSKYVWIVNVLDHCSNFTVRYLYFFFIRKALPIVSLYSGILISFLDYFYVYCFYFLVYWFPIPQKKKKIGSFTCMNSFNLWKRIRTCRQTNPNLQMRTPRLRL